MTAFLHIYINPSVNCFSAFKLIVVYHFRAAPLTMTVMYASPSGSVAMPFSWLSASFINIWVHLHWNFASPTSYALHLEYQDHFTYIRQPHTYIRSLFSSSTSFSSSSPICTSSLVGMLLWLFSLNSMLPLPCKSRLLNSIAGDEPQCLLHFHFLSKASPTLVFLMPLHSFGKPIGSLAAPNSLYLVEMF